MTLNSPCKYCNKNSFEKTPGFIIGGEKKQQQHQILAAMEGKASRSLKRPISEDDDESNKPSVQKKPRFPKGKKVKEGDVAVVANVSGPQEDPSNLPDPKIAAKERSHRRIQQRSQMLSQLLREENEGKLPHMSVAEVQYQDNANFVDDGIEIEPFNLNQEREEGYFDAEGNFVEYLNKDEKDAWLDSVEVDTRFAQNIVIEKENVNEISSLDIGKIKRRMANLLKPGETVLQALRRLKETTNDKKGKMPAEVKHVFDQLTEDSMKLMDNGDYDVYHDKREAFVREAEGYEKLARARENMFAEDDGAGDDMFAEASDNPNLGQSSNGSELVSGHSTAGHNSQPSSESLNINSDNGGLQTDYVYDESSGYYYSSSLGYYYDPASRLYCCASSGRWYSYNEQTSTYDELQGEDGENPAS